MSNIRGKKKNSRLDEIALPAVPLVLPGNEEGARYLDVIREMIRHENDLANQRLGWLLTVQGLLFTATSLLWTGSPLPVAVFCGVGGLSCLSVGYTLTRGSNAVKDLLATARTYKEALPHGMVFPPIIGSRHKAIEWLVPARLLPWVFGLAWIAILVLRLGKFGR